MTFDLRVCALVVCVCANNGSADSGGFTNLHCAIINMNLVIFVATELSHILAADDNRPR